MDEVTGFSLLFAGVGLLFIGLSVPLILGRVPPNSFYGCRTARSLSDPKVWYEANRRFGRNFFISGLIVFAASAIMIAFGRTADSNFVVIALLTVLIVSMGWAAWCCVRPGDQVEGR